MKTNEDLQMDYLGLITILLLSAVYITIIPLRDEKFDLEVWLKKAAFSGLTIKVNMSEKDGQLTISFSDTYRKKMDENLRKLRDDGNKAEAIKKLRREVGIELREAKDYVEAL